MLDIKEREVGMREEKIREKREESRKRKEEKKMRERREEGRKKFNFRYLFL